MEDLDGDFISTPLTLWDFYDFSFFFRGDWGLEASNKYQPTVLEPKADLMSNSPAARTVFAILEVGFEAAEEGMSRSFRSCLWLCRGDWGV